MSIRDATLGKNYPTIDVTGLGLVALDGASLSLERVDIFENYFVGAAFDGEETTVSAIDLVVRDTIPGVAGVLGWGISADEGVNLSITRGLISLNMDVGLKLKPKALRYILKTS